MIRPGYLFLCLILGVVLAGCVNVGSGTSPSRHYLIPSLADQGINSTDRHPGGPRVTILPVEPAAYLDRSQLVIRKKTDQLELSQYDRWAEPPAENLRRVLKENLELLTTRAQMTTARGDFQLLVELQRLEGTKKGALLQLSWRLSRKGSDEVIEQGRFRLVEAVDGSAAAQLVTGYGKAVAAFSRELALKLDQLPAE
jgi:uncharacterized lipoprotein YmbA